MESVTVTCEQSVWLFLFYFQKLSIQATKDLIGTVLDEQVCVALTPFGFYFLCIVIVTVVWDHHASVFNLNIQKITSNKE